MTIEQRVLELASTLSAGSDPDPSAERLWRELWQGGWSDVHVREEKGQRSLVAQRTNPPSQRPLTAREREVLARALDGMAPKNIAAELGTTVATVSTQLG